MQAEKDAAGGDDDASEEESAENEAAKDDEEQDDRIRYDPSLLFARHVPEDPYDPCSDPQKQEEGEVCQAQKIGGG